MKLEIEHTREFYLAKVKEYPLLEDMIAGRSSFKEQLDGIITRLDETPGIFAKLLRKNADSADGMDEGAAFENYLAMVVDLSNIGLDEEKLNSETLSFEMYRTFRDGSLSSLAISGLGLAGLSFPPLALVGAIVLGVGAVGGWISSICTLVCKCAKMDRDEIFSPVYEVAEEIDARITRCFALEHFREARPRFEQTYIALDQEERETVDAQLHSYLAAGGMPGTDEQQLNEYLSGLLAQEAEGDA